MIRHIVMWKFKEGEQEKAARFMAGLAALGGRLAEVAAMSVRQNITANGKNYDAVLIADFASAEAMRAYLENPEHKALSALCKSIRESRAAVDFEL